MKPELTKDIRYIGVDDLDIDLFEGQYKVPEGISYNSYLILDEKVAVMDTADRRKGDEWHRNLTEALAGRTPDYLVVHHMEPDHASLIARVAEEFPALQIVLSAQAQKMLPQFFDQDLSNRLIQVKEGDSLSLGSHTLHFILAPMVHWPEVMVSYEDSEKVLFSADGFGTFGAISENLPWIREARRYFINIVGKYGPSVQGLLKKAAALDIETIAPLHGPVLSDKLEEYIGYYDTWSRYEAEEEGIVIPYASAHGNTKEAALFMADLLEKAGQKVIPMDLNREDMAKAVENAFRYDRMILAAITYDGALFPAMEDFLYHLEIKNFQKRKVGIIENGSWGPLAGKKMREHLESMKEIEIVEPVVTIRTRRQSKDQAQFEALRDAML